MLTASRLHRAPVIFVLASVLLLIAACTPSHPQSTFDTRGPVAQDQVTLFYWIFWAGLLVFIVVMGAMIYAAIRYRRKPGDEEDPPQIHGHKGLEIAWTIAPALVLLVITVPTLQSIFYSANPPETAGKGEITVEAIGHQWWFEFRYPEYGVVTANELHIPVNEVVKLKLDSVDVLHSFWVPKLAGKVDMIPNNDNTMWMEADEPGEYYGQCAEFCGVSHANMRFRVIAESRADFDAWMAAQAADAVEPNDPLAKEGHDLFMSRKVLCFRCHTVAGTRLARGTIGPNLTHFAGRRQMAAGIIDNNQENVRRWLEDPAEVKPGNIMARDAEVYNGLAEPLTEPEVSALVAYLRTLR